MIPPTAAPDGVHDPGRVRGPSTYPDDLAQRQKADSRVHYALRDVPQPRQPPHPGAGLLDRLFGVVFDLLRLRPALRQDQVPFPRRPSRYSTLSMGTRPAILDRRARRCQARYI